MILISIQINPMNDSYQNKLLQVYNLSPEANIDANRGVVKFKHFQEADSKTMNPSQDKSNVYYPKKAGEKIDPDKDLRVVSQRDLRSGIVLMFGYYPKWEKELPFYDAFPMTMLFGIGNNRFIGFNLHYLQLFPAYRNSLLRLLTNQKRGAGGFSYRRIKRFFGGLPASVLKYCVKEYLFSHIISKVKFVPEAYYIELLSQVRGDFKKMSPSQIREWIINKSR